MRMILKQVLNKLTLTLNEDKTSIKDARKEVFTFLGFNISLIDNPHTGKCFPYVEPSTESVRSIKTKIKYYTRRAMTPVPIVDIIKQLNSIVRGWSNYFYYDHGHKKIKKLNST